MAINAKNVEIKLEAVNAFWGREHCRSVKTVADVSSSLNDTYFDLNAMGADYETETLYYVWFNVGAAGTDPSIAGKTGVEVAISANDSAATVASAIQSAVDALGLFDATVSGDLVTIENVNMGKITVETDSGSTGFTLEVLRLGLGGDLGKTAEGGTSLSFEADTVQLTSDQTGSFPLGDVMRGAVIGAEMTLIEMTKDRWETVVGSVIGDIHTPSGGTSLVGIGEDKLYKNLIDYAGKLILHPISLEDSDKSRDVVFHKCAPVPSSINFSGSDVQGMEVTFNAYLDQSGNVNSKINMFSFGDHTQDLA
jgi:hypothetical protein